MEVTNSFKGLVLIDRVPEALWRVVHDIVQDWNTKVGTQELLGVTGIFGHGVQKEAGQRLTELCEETALVIVTPHPTTQEIIRYTWTSPDGQY